MPGNVFVDDGKGKFEVGAMPIFDRAFDDLAVDVEKIAVVVEPAFPSNIEIPLAKIRLIVLEVFEQVFIKGKK